MIEYLLAAGWHPQRIFEWAEAYRDAMLGYAVDDEEEDAYLLALKEAQANAFRASALLESVHDSKVMILPLAR